MDFSLFDLWLKDKKHINVSRSNDPKIAPFIYEKLLYAYEKFPNNDEVPQYFSKMLYA